MIERDVVAPVTFYWAADLSPASSTIITAAAKSGRFVPERGDKKRFRWAPAASVEVERRQVGLVGQRLDVSGAAVIDPPR